jgi:serine/threonine protein kinase/tetratricopeptide (TPR) repeat protein
MIGKSVAHYSILDQLGAGGMGVVYKARDTRLNRFVALKVLPAERTDPERRRRLLQEAQAASALNHPNIVTVHDAASDAGVDFIVMEFIAGKTLHELIGGTGLKLETALKYAGQITDALAAAHAAGIVHRDLKPGNVMVTESGLVKVLDFGLAKLTEPPSETRSTRTVGPQTADGAIVGTVAYMSPEQAQGKRLDLRSDIFSFGSLFYEMLTGRPPWPRSSSLEMMYAIVHDDPPSFQTALGDSRGPSMVRVVRRCLEKQPEKRFQTMTEVRAALDHSANDRFAKPAEQQTSIAVLPFANMTAEKENEYFSDGLAEEIINVLAHAPGMKVAGRTSSFFFRGKDVEFAEIGRRLNVEHILEGSVRKAGNRIRVTAQLIKVSDGFHLWSERYDRELTDIFAIQDEITQAIAEALRVKLQPGSALLGRHEPDLRAYDAYLKAREHWFKGTLESQTRFKRFVDLSIELDPKFALPYFLLGAQYSMIANLGIAPAKEVIPLGRAAEQEALRLDPSLAEPHALLACFAGYEYDWSTAERHWQIAMAREPVCLSSVKASDIRLWYGNHYLLPIGRTTEALDAVTSGLQEDPLNLLYRTILADALRNAGRLKDCEAELQKILEIDENFAMALGTLGAMNAQQGRIGEALAATEKAYQLMPWANQYAGQLAALLVRTGDTSRAESLIDGLRSGRAYLAPAGLAVFHAMRGEFDRAAEWAEKAIDEQWGTIIKTLRPLLSSTAVWPVLAKRMNLPESQLR